MDIFFSFFFLSSSSQYFVLVFIFLLLFFFFFLLYIFLFLAERKRCSVMGNRDILKWIERQKQMFVLGARLSWSVIFPVISVVIRSSLPSNPASLSPFSVCSPRSSSLVPEGRPGMSDVNLLSGISGLSFDSPFLSPLLFFLPSPLVLSVFFNLVSIN